MWPPESANSAEYRQSVCLAPKLPMVLRMGLDRSLSSKHGRALSWVVSCRCCLAPSTQRQLTCGRWPAWCLSWPRETSSLTPAPAKTMTGQPQTALIIQLLSQFGSPFVPCTRIWWQGELVMDATCALRNLIRQELTHHCAVSHALACCALVRSAYLHYVCSGWGTSNGHLPDV